MKIKFHPIKSNGTLRRTPLSAHSLEELEKLQAEYGTEGQYLVDGLITDGKSMVEQVATDKALRQQVEQEKAQAQYNEKFEELKKKVEALAPDEQKMYWLLYGNLDAIFIPAYYSEDEDGVELTFKGIPLERIRVKK